MPALTSVELMAAVADHRPVPTPAPEVGVRFAFHGRMSTSEFQDPQTSRAWQRAVSDELIDGIGSVVVEFFDVGRSRRWSWWERPEASALLAAASGSDRLFDAVVIGEYERAFYGDQFRELVSRLNELGVEVWLPEAGGLVELDSPVHQALMVLLGAQAQREVARARQRVLAAMRAQTSQQGRFLGGRPPYGYRLVDGGPHPNARHSGWGRRLQVLAPDPVTAPWVRWMFRERAGGRALASIARELNDRGVACPSSADPGRNAHRQGARWMVSAVASILENPRYTGRQVWNRHGTRGGVLEVGRAVVPRAGWSGTPSRRGRCPRSSHTSLWSMTRPSSRFTGSGHQDRPKTVGNADTRWLVWSCAGCVTGRWTLTGCTVGLPTGADTASTARRPGLRMRRPTPTSARTSYLRHSQA